MEHRDTVVIDLEALAELMARAIPDLECPECCGPVHEFIEVGARFYQEEWEWACLATVLVHSRRNRK
ncbi:MAG: hypothetical protein JWQ00_2808 [Noviherbaspirillum sp.]|jgi:hypothetical protein|nr:hypothetical protein [Noviherbaspirillum sp.]